VQITKCNSSSAKNKGFFIELLRRHREHEGFTEEAEIRTPPEIAHFMLSSGTLIIVLYISGPLSSTLITDLRYE
jgi:hypothetical protein